MSPHLMSPHLRLSHPRLSHLMPSAPAKPTAMTLSPWIIWKTKSSGAARNQDKETAQARIQWTDGLLTGFLGYENQDCVDGGFDNLRDCIFNFARSMAETVDWASLDVETQQMLRTWAPKAKGYLETPQGARGKSKFPTWLDWVRELTNKRVPVIFQGWLWRIVVDDIFGGPGDQPHWKSYNELLRVTERECKFLFHLPLAAEAVFNSRMHFLSSRRLDARRPESGPEGDQHCGSLLANGGGRPSQEPTLALARPDGGAAEVGSRRHKVSL